MSDKIICYKYFFKNLYLYEKNKDRYQKYKCKNDDYKHQLNVISLKNYISNYPKYPANYSLSNTQFNYQYFFYKNLFSQSVFMNTNFPYLSVSLS